MSVNIAYIEAMQKIRENRAIAIIWFLLALVALAALFYFAAIFEMPAISFEGIDNGSGESFGGTVKIGGGGD
jgi:hypothetical protein